MIELWLPLLAAAADLDRPFATEAALAQLRVTSAATVGRYLETGPGQDAHTPNSSRQWPLESKESIQPI